MSFWRGFVVGYLIGSVVRHRWLRLVLLAALTTVIVVVLAAQITA